MTNDPRLYCHFIYRVLVTRLCTELRAAKNEVDIAMKGQKSDPAWHYFCNVSSRWLLSTNSVSNQACDDVMSGKSEQAEFNMNGTKYRVSKHYGQIVQTNLSTKFTRALDFKDTAVFREKMAYRTILCRDEFFTNLDSETINLWRKGMASRIDHLPEQYTYTRSQAIKESSSQHLHECVVELVHTIVELSDCKGKANPDECLLLIKPYMLMSVLLKFSELKEVHVRPVIHGTTNKNLQLMGKSIYGMKSVFSKPGCQMGMANYVSPVYSLPYTYYSNAGKTLLLLLFSHSKTTSANPSIVEFNLTETHTDAQGRPFKNAYAVRQDDHLLPIAIIPSP